MKIDKNQWKWTRQPANFSIEEDSIEITTAPHTDLWQRTYYHFRNDNAPVLQIKSSEPFFSFVVKTEFESKRRFDQCGVVMYLDSENWLKASIEYENEVFQHLGSVVTNEGYSDWATTEIDAGIQSMWYRFSRREDDFCLECSEDGGSLQADADLPHGKSKRRNPVRHLCLQPGGFFFQGDLYSHGNHAVPVAGPRWSGTRRNLNR